MMHLGHPKLPRFRFDWDPVTHKLYLVELLVKPVIGHIIIEDVKSPQAAQFAVVLWCGGYLAKERERFDPKRPQHHRLVADAGFLSVFSPAQEDMNGPRPRE